MAGFRANRRVLLRGGAWKAERTLPLNRMPKAQKTIVFQSTTDANGSFCLH